MVSEPFMKARQLMDVGSEGYDLSAAASAAKDATSFDADAKYLYALFQYLGEGGVQKDADSARKLLEEASAEGSNEAQIVLKEMDKNPPEVMQ